MWWFENWRVDASMNGVPLWGVPGVFVLLILSNRSVPRLLGGCVDCVRECFGKPPALLVWVVFR